MKAKLRFTRGELTAVLSILAIMLASNLFCHFYKPRPKAALGMQEYAMQFEKFVEMQKVIDDSIRKARDKVYSSGDSVPAFAKKPKKKMYEIVRLDINSCDTSDLVVIPQFGSKRAAKLVEYREKLGGFHSLSQLQEVFVLQNIDTVRLKEYLYCKKDAIRKINVNNATYAELVAHPYLDSYLSKIIVRHRSSKGPIRDLDELQQITHAYPELISRLRHYVCF